MLRRSAGRDVPAWAWAGLASVSILVGARYLATESLIFEPGGWFALDGRRFLEAGTAWRAGSDPYSIDGFVYSPVAVIAAAMLSLLPPAPVLLTWLAASLVGGMWAVWMEASTTPGLLRLLSPIAAAAFIPSIADLILVNVTIALVVAAWIAIRRDTFASGIALGVLGAAFPKPFLLPILLWLLVWHRGSATGAIVAGLAASLGATVITGPAAWLGFIDALRRIGTSDLDFVGNYGISRLAPDVVPIVLVWSVFAFGVVLLRGDRGSGLVAATSAGVLIAPYAGIYAALPMLLSYRDVVRWSPVGALVIGAIAIVTAPWALVVAVPLGVIALARTLRGPREMAGP